MQMKYNYFSNYFFWIHYDKTPSKKCTQKVVILSVIIYFLMVSA